MMTCTEVIYIHRCNARNAMDRSEALEGYDEAGGEIHVPS